MGCLFSLLPGIHSVCQLYCRAEHSTKKCLRLIIDWEICTRHKKLLASHFDKQCCFVRYSIALNWTRWITAQAHTVPQAFLGGVWWMCAENHLQKESSCCSQLEQRGGEEGKWVAFPSHFPKNKGVCISFVLRRGLVFSFICLIGNTAPLPS